MAAKRKKGRTGPKTPEGKARALANLKPVQPGEVRNPHGRPRVGATLIEWLNILGDQGATEAQLLAITRNKDLPFPKRAAALRALRMIEVADLADFQELCEGLQSLEQLRDAGVDTSIVKRCKTRTWTDEKEVQHTERDVELHDRSGEEFDRVCDRTEGKPVQVNKHEGGVGLGSVQFIIPGLPAGGTPQDEIG